MYRMIRSNFFLLGLTVKVACNLSVITLDVVSKLSLRRLHQMVAGIHVTRPLYDTSDIVDIQSQGGSMTSLFVSFMKCTICVRTERSTRMMGDLDARAAWVFYDITIRYDKKWNALQVAQSIP